MTFELHPPDPDTTLDPTPLGPTDGLCLWAVVVVGLAAATVVPWMAMYGIVTTTRALLAMDALELALACIPLVLLGGTVVFALGRGRHLPAQVGMVSLGLVTISWASGLALSRGRGQLAFTAPGAAAMVVGDLGGYVAALAGWRDAKAATMGIASVVAASACVAIVAHEFTSTRWTF